MATSKIQICQRAFANTGNGLLVSLDDGSIEATIVSNSYDARVEAMLTQHAWKFARRVTALTKLSAEPELPWTALWSAPLGMLSLSYVVDGDTGVRVDCEERDLVSGKAIAVMADCDTLNAVHTYLVTADRFPGDFALALQTYVEADALRSINEQIDQADRREKLAAGREQKARTRDQRSSTATDANEWDLTAARDRRNQWRYARR